MKNKTRWVTETAVMTALLITLQNVTKPFGQFVTGSCVNFVLAETLFLCGTESALTVAILSPFVAFLLGIGPAFILIVPAVSLGNSVLVLILDRLPGKTISIAAASSLKAIVLYVMVNVWILPALSLPAKQAAVIGASFSWPQFVTALIGSYLARAVYPKLGRALIHNS